MEPQHHRGAMQCTMWGIGCHMGHTPGYLRSGLTCCFSGVLQLLPCPCFHSTFMAVSQDGTLFIKYYTTFDQGLQEFVCTIQGIGFHLGDSAGSAQCSVFMRIPYFQLTGGKKASLQFNDLSSSQLMRRCSQPVSENNGVFATGLRWEETDLGPFFLCIFFMYTFV